MIQFVMLSIVVFLIGLALGAWLFWYFIDRKIDREIAAHQEAIDFYDSWEPRDDS